jgi:hypothetical protein
MPYQGLGARRTSVATKACAHAQIVTEQKFVGTAFRVEQLGYFVDPSNAAAKAIDIGDVFEIQVGGIHEAAKSGTLAAAALGDRIWILPATNALALDAGATTGAFPVGVVDEIDATRTPNVLRISAENMGAFLAHA